MSDPIVSAKRMSAAREAVVAGSVVAAAVVVLMLAPGLGPTGPVLVAGLAWSATLVLAAAASTTFGRAGGRPPGAGPGLVFAVRVLAVTTTLVAGGLAWWLTFDRANNISDEDLESLLTDSGADIAAGLDADEAPSVGLVRVALAAQLDGTTYAEATAPPERVGEDPPYDREVDPAGLRVLPVAERSPDEYRYQVTDDDGGSPTCLVLVDSTEDAGAYRAEVVEGWC